MEVWKHEPATLFMPAKEAKEVEVPGAYTLKEHVQWMNIVHNRLENKALADALSSSNRSWWKRWKLRLSLWMERRALSFLIKRECLVGFDVKAQALSPYKQKVNEETIKKISINPDMAFETIINHIVESERQVYALYNKEVEFLVVGRDIATRFMSDVSLMSFHMPDHHLRYSMGVGRTPLTLHGIEIRVVPWFEGVLLVPRDGR